MYVVFSELEKKLKQKNLFIEKGIWRSGLRAENAENKLHFRDRFPQSGLSLSNTWKGFEVDFKMENVDMNDCDYQKK